MHCEQTGIWKVAVVAHFITHILSSTWEDSVTPREIFIPYSIFEHKPEYTNVNQFNCVRKVLQQQNSCEW
jgi:hypothetical protein